MSYQKYYGRQFVQLGEDKYLPLVLWGANNCTEFVGGREVLERYWSSFSPTEVTDVATFARYIWDKAESNPNGEVWKNGSKWVCWRNMDRWMQNAFGSSKTIEEIYALAGRALRLTLYKRQWDCRDEVLKTVYCTTTDGILSFFEYYDNLPEEAKKGCYVWYDFGTREPLKFPKPAIEGKVIVKDRANKRYLSRIDSANALSFSPDPNEALVFKSEKDVWEQIGSVWKSSVKVFSEKALERAKEAQNFAIVCVGRGFVYERTRSHLSFTPYKASAKKFATEKEAERYKEKLDVSFNAEFEVCDLRSGG